MHMGGADKHWEADTYLASPIARTVQVLLHPCSKAGAGWAIIAPVKFARLPLVQLWKHSTGGTSGLRRAA